MSTPDSSVSGVSNIASTVTWLITREDLLDTVAIKTPSCTALLCAVHIIKI